MSIQSRKPSGPLFHWLIGLLALVLVIVFAMALHWLWGLILAPFGLPPLGYDVAFVFSFAAYVTTSVVITSRETVEATQRRVAKWITSTFGPEFTTPAARQERGLRVAEEAIELAQALGVPQDTMQRLVSKVYTRPTGVAWKELAQVLVTLCGCAEVLGESLQERVTQELDRLETPEAVERARKRQAEKREALLTSDQFGGGGDR